jgi:hypothetical protein
VPYAIFRNHPEITDQPEKLGTHLQDVTEKLRRLRHADASSA